MNTLRRPILIASLCAALLLLAAWQSQPTTQPLSEVQKQLQEEAEGVRPLMKSSLCQSFLDGAKSLPAIRPATIYRDLKTRQYMSSLEYEKLDPLAQGQTKVYNPTEKFFYYTKYGTPVAYARPIELLGQAGMNEFASKKILDFGYGTIGHLRMMASRGANVFGLDVDSLLAALYGLPGATGPFKGEGGLTGSVTLLKGRFSEDIIKTSVGDDYDLIISKNTLKRGYLHPEKEVDKRLLVDLGVDDETFVKTLFDRLKPGGYLMIYNITPKQANLDAGESYIPWADGRCPFDRELLEKTGFTVIEFDRNDDAAAREMAHALKWDSGEEPMDIQSDLFAQYTLLRKPPAQN